MNKIKYLLILILLISSNLFSQDHIKKEFDKRANVYFDVDELSGDKSYSISTIKSGSLYLSGYVWEDKKEKRLVFYVREVDSSFKKPFRVSFFLDGIEYDPKNYDFRLTDNGWVSWKINSEKNAFPKIEELTQEVRSDLAKLFIKIEKTERVFIRIYLPGGNQKTSGSITNEQKKELADLARVYLAIKND